MLGPVVERLVNNKDEHVGWVFWCSGCEEVHQYDHRWTFNGDETKPTFSPSLLVRGEDWSSGERVETRCHLFVTDGEICFLGDCTHKLKGQTVLMEPLPW